MIYVCSDIHGCAERFYTLLKEIKFSDTDTMYILGDIIDRNDDSIELLKYVMKKDNIHLLMGNHEEFMYSYLVRLNVLGKLDERVNLPNDIWLSDNNGGRITLNDFVKEPIDNKIEILKYLSELPLIVLLEVNGNKFHLSHAGTISKVLDKDIWYVYDVSRTERNIITWFCPYRDNEFISHDNYPKDYISIIGHVPVERLNEDYKYTILRDNNIINIDSGCAMYKIEQDNTFFETALSCLCLDTMNVIYVR